MTNNEAADNYRRNAILAQLDSIHAELGAWEVATYRMRLRRAFIDMGCTVAEANALIAPHMQEVYDVARDMRPGYTFSTR